MRGELAKSNLTTLGIRLSRARYIGCICTVSGTSTCVIFDSEAQVIVHEDNCRYHEIKHMMNHINRRFENIVWVEEIEEK